MKKRWHWNERTRLLLHLIDVADMAGRDPAAVPEPYRLTIRWTAEQLGPEQQRFLAAWPKTRCRNLPGLGEMLYCHATPRNENECFTRLTPESRLCRFSRDWA